MAQDQIFDELDEKTRPRSACTCGTMVVLLIILFILAVISSLYVIKLAQTKVQTPTITPSQVSKEQLIEKLASFVKSAPGQKSMTLEITEQELTTLLVEAAAADQNFPLKGIQAAITAQAIIISGTLTKPLNSDLTIEVVPAVADGKLDFELTKFKAGKVSLPKPVIGLVSKKLGQLLAQKLELARDLTISSVTLKSGVMVIQ